MKKLKILLALCAVLSVGMMSIPVSAAESDTSSSNYEVTVQDGEEILTAGPWGADGKWKFDIATGTLTISGTGELGHLYTNYNRKSSSSGETLRLRLQTENVKTVIIENGVTGIERGFFSSFNNLISVTIPNSVTTITEGVFYNCTGLTSVTIPKSVTSIGRNVFENTPWLDAQLKENPFVVAGSVVIASNPDTCTGDIAIPEGVTTIAAAAFEDCTNLTSVTIPESLTHIGEQGFYNCDSLTSIIIPDSVTNIGGHAFYNTPWLNAQLKENPFVAVNSIIIDSSRKNCVGDIVIPEGVTTITKYAFSYCDDLTSITIPDSMTSIGQSAFYNCTSLTSITIPDSVTEIGDDAFEGCAGLTSITIPDSVTNIGSDAFSGTSWLDTQLEKNPVAIAGSVVIASNPITCTGELVIPETVTTIGDSAFEDCENLTSVILPNNVKCIRYRAFSICKSLTSITIKNPTCEIDDYIVPYNATIYGYPNSTAQAYAEENYLKFEALDGEPPKTEPIQGDADGDGTLAVADVVAIQKAILGGETLPNWESCDLYPDGVINVFDLLALKRKLIYQ